MTVWTRKRALTNGVWVRIGSFSQKWRLKRIVSASISYNDAIGAGLHVSDDPIISNVSSSLQVFHRKSFQSPQAPL